MVYLYFPERKSIAFTGKPHYERHLQRKECIERPIAKLNNENFLCILILNYATQSISCIESSKFLNIPRKTNVKRLAKTYGTCFLLKGKHNNEKYATPLLAVLTKKKYYWVVFLKLKRKLCFFREMPY